MKKIVETRQLRNDLKFLNAHLDIYKNNAIKIILGVRFSMSLSIYQEAYPLLAKSYQLLLALPISQVEVFLLFVKKSKFVYN